MKLTRQMAEILHVRWIGKWIGKDKDGCFKKAEKRVVDYKAR